MINAQTEGDFLALMKNRKKLEVLMKHCKQGEMNHIKFSMKKRKQCTFMSIHTFRDFLHLFLVLSKPIPEIIFQILAI
jgi:hypothetical protein